MPRPDVARLGIGYRRIPLLSIGRDVYLDTKLQLSKLEALDVSAPRLGASEGDKQAVERLLCKLMTDGGVFASAATLLPTDLPLLKNPAFQKDRKDFFGSPPKQRSKEQIRPNALREVAEVFKLLETTLLADGRDWILKTDKPGLADIEAVWPVHWLLGLPGALPKDDFSAEVYPKVFAWVQRFEAAVQEAKKKLGKPKTLSGEEASKSIVQSRYNEAEGSVSGSDYEVAALGLAKGDSIVVAPTDMGQSGKDFGKLVGITHDEVIYETQGQDGAVRVHAPRHGYGIRKADDSKL